MDDAKQIVVQALGAVVEKLLAGTNWALCRFLWMLVSGVLHDSRGALFPALKRVSLSDAETHRAWAAVTVTFTTQPVMHRSGGLTTQVFAASLIHSRQAAIKALAVSMPRCASSRRYTWPGVRSGRPLG